jgi:hypothetical protein
MAFAQESASQTPPPPPQVRCTGCGRLLRLLPERAGSRQSCPGCKTFTPHPRHWEFVRECRRFGCAFAILAILGLIPLTWPVGLYLVAVSVIAFVFQCLKYVGEESGADKSTNKMRVLKFNIFKALRDAASSVGVGMAIVCVAQLLLQTIFFFVEPEAIRTVEEWIVSKRAGLAGLLQFKWLLLTLAIVVFAALIWPSTKPVSRYLYVRNWALRLLIVLSVVSSFTFFTSDAIAAGERRWVAERKDEYEKAAANVRSARVTLAKAAYVQKRLETLPKKSRSDLRTFFEGASRSPIGREIIQKLATNIAEKVPPGKGPSEDTFRSGNSPQNAGSADSPIEISLERIERWDANDHGSTRSSTPTFEDGARVTEEAKKCNKAVEEAMAAVEEVVKAIVGDHLAPIVELIKPFAEALIGGTVETFLPKEILSGIHSFKDATNIISLNLTPQERSSAWDLDVGTVAQYEKPSPGTVPPVPMPDSGLFGDSPFEIGRSGARSGESVTMKDFSDGLKQGWIVTRNSSKDPHTLFVHRTESLYGLIGLKFLIKESPDEKVWTVYLPNERGGFGQLIGNISRPSQIEVGECECPAR